MKRSVTPLIQPQIYPLPFFWNGSYWVDAGGISHFDPLLKAVTPPDHQPHKATICFSSEHQPHAQESLAFVQISTYTDTYSVPAFPNLPLIPLTAPQIPKLQVWWLDILFD